MRAFTLFFLFGIILNLQAQRTTKRAPGELIVQLEVNQDLEDFMNFSSKQWKSEASIQFVKTLFHQLNIHLFQFDEDQISFQDIENVLEKNVFVSHVQGNHAVQLRKTPNDNLFSNQFALEIIKATEVWNFTEGGSTVQGDEIVVAVIDDGFDHLHEDLIDNVWTNEDEIPDDGIDNDNNGYIDDYYGLNVKTGKDNHQMLSHGTSVAGIIGAKGNNGIGVSGVSWNVKIMLLSGIKFEAEIVEAYQYALNERVVFNNSSGTDGSFVVATNSSFGIPEAFADDYKPWCDTFDAMGEAGILSVCAADNLDSDVEINGDMPSSCTSPYLIAVTNTDQQDIKVSGAGFGAISIDLGAPGDESHTLKLENGYGEFGGTSASCPHVAGGIGLLYGAPCDAFISFVKSNPSQAALSLKSIILNNVDPLSSLEGITTSGGRLNLFNSLLAVGEFCEASSGDLGFLEVSPNPVEANEVKIVYETPDFEIYELVVYNSIGQVIHYKEIIPPLFSKKITTIITTDWARGIYYTCLYGPNNKVCSSFFVL